MYTVNTMEYVFSDKLASLKPSAIREIFKTLSDPTIISFAAGNPSPLSFPVEALSEISADIFKNSAAKALQYGTTEGYGPLRQAVEERLRNKFAISTENIFARIQSSGLILSVQITQRDRSSILSFCFALCLKYNGVWTDRMPCFSK